MPPATISALREARHAFISIRDVVSDYAFG
jgi:hypothetical protein